MTIKNYGDIEKAAIDLLSALDNLKQGDSPRVVINEYNALAEALKLPRHKDGSRCPHPAAGKVCNRGHGYVSPLWSE